MHCKSFWIKEDAKCINVNETTIMDNTADLAMDQKMIIDTLHKEGKSQRVITERGGCSSSAVSKHIKCKVNLKEEIGYGKVDKQRIWLQAWEYCQAKLIQTLGRAPQGVNWSWSQYIKSHWRVERHRIHVAWSPVWNFHSLWWFGLPCHLLVLLEMLTSFSSRTWHLPTLPKVPKAGSMSMVLLCLIGQQTRLTWPLWGIVKRKIRDTRPNNEDDLKAAIKATCASITP